jgi:hypothetical protein
MIGYRESVRGWPTSKAQYVQLIAGALAALFGSLALLATVWGFVLRSDAIGYGHAPPCVGPAADGCRTFVDGVQIDMNEYRGARYARVTLPEGPRLTYDGVTWEPAGAWNDDDAVAEFWRNHLTLVRSKDGKHELILWNNPQRRYDGVKRNVPILLTAAIAFSLVWLGAQLPALLARRRSTV